MIRSMNANAVRVPDAISRNIWAASMTIRRSEMSASAPAGSDSSMIGRAVEDCTSATMSADGASEVMSHEAPTASISPPKFDTRLAVQIETNMRDLKGASVADARHEAGSLRMRRERSVT